MWTLRRAAVLIALLSALAGCAGGNFVRPSAEAFPLGQTTYAQVVQQMGEPRTVGDVVTNGQKVKSMTYRYTTTTDMSWQTGVVPVRTLVYYFHNDTLVGFEFVSSFRSDNTDFDDTKIGAIAKGRTTRAEVIQLLGQPSASYIPPMVRETSGEAIGYGYARRESSAPYKFFRKNLRITFDDRDQVAEIDFTTAGKK